MPFQSRPATRVGIKPLLGIFGESGGGKTRSALLLARGIVGSQGRITLIDTENGRGHIFADVIPGGYNVVDFTPPFSPERYVEAIEYAEKGSDIIIIDSMTHEWAGEDGILDMQEKELTRMAGYDYAKRESCKMASWIKPKMLHKKMVMRILRSPLPLICCLRGEHKTHMGKNAQGKSTVSTDTKCSPIFDKNFIFEMLINGEIFSRDGEGGFLRVDKITHETLLSCLPKEGEKISIHHGELIARWCASPGDTPKSAPAEVPAAEEHSIEEWCSVVEAVMKAKGKEEYTIKAGGTEFVTTKREFAEIAKQSHEKSIIANIQHKGSELLSITLPEGK